MLRKHATLWIKLQSGLNMKSYVLIKQGRLNNGTVIRDVTVETQGGMKRDHNGRFLVVWGNGTPGLRTGKNRLYIDALDDYQPAAGLVEPAPVEDVNILKQTDQEIQADIDETFEILGEMTDAVASNIVKGLVVSGPSGIGKSHTVETRLHRALAMKQAIQGRNFYECIHGDMSGICLYEKLWEFRHDGQVLVFDDCDSVLYDEDSLNVLKAALDSRKTRTIHWGSQNRNLVKNDIPNSFEYRGGIIFITNLKFDQVRSHRIQNHLAAIMSRCHYMDLGINTTREKLLHIRNVVERHNLLGSYGFNVLEQQEILDFVTHNVNRLHELSLRTVTKVADLRAAMPTKWQRFAEKNCMKKS